MNAAENYLELEDADLLAQCELHVYKASGPGGQHRNKVSSAVRLRHKPTGISAHGDESRSQHDNKRMALRRMRMNIACRHRREVSGSRGIPGAVAECIFTPKKHKNNKIIDGQVQRKLKVGRRDRRFWTVAAYLLDVLEHYNGRLSEAAEHVAISTGNYASMLKSERHLLAATQQIRKSHGHATLK